MKLNMISPKPNCIRTLCQSFGFVLLFVTLTMHSKAAGANVCNLADLSAKTNTSSDNLAGRQWFPVGSCVTPARGAHQSALDTILDPTTILLVMIWVGAEAVLRHLRLPINCRRYVPLLGPWIATLALCCIPFEETKSATIPPAEYQSSIRIKSPDGERRVESRNEGSISLDYSTSNPQWFLQFVASAQITGGNQLTVDITGDLQRSSGISIFDPKASSYAWMSYFFTVTKKNPDAPNAPVPFIISARVHGSVTPGSTGKAASVRAGVSYRHPQAANAEMLVGVQLGGGAGAQSRDLAFEGLRAQMPDAVGVIYLWAEGEFYSGAVDGPSGSFQAIADPYVRIDPTFTVIINGVERLGSEVYGLEFSEGIGPGVPEPPAVWMLMIAGALLTVRRKQE